MKRQVEERAREIAEEFKPQQLALGPEMGIRVLCADLSSACQKLGEVKLVEMVQFLKVLMSRPLVKSNVHVTLLLPQQEKWLFVR